MSFYEKNFLEKKSHNAEKTERGALWDFPTSILSQISKKIEGGTLWENFFSEKSLNAEKKLKGGTPWSGVTRTARYGVTRENRRNRFGSVR